MSVRERLCRFLDHRWTRRTALVVGLVASGLWLYSCGVYYRTLEPLALAWRTPYALGQVCSQNSSLHFLLMAQPADAKPTIAIERLTHLGYVGYNHGAVEGLGFAFVCLPREFNGGDYTVPAHLAIAIPYWFIVGMCVAVVARWTVTTWCTSAPTRHHS